MRWHEVLSLAAIGGFALVLAGLGTYRLLEAQWFRRRAARAAGVVVWIDSQWVEVPRSADGGTSHERVLLHYPVVAFYDRDGARREARAGLGSEARSHRPGDAVHILHDPDNPAAVRPGSARSPYLPAAYCFGGAALALAFYWGFFRPAP